MDYNKAALEMHETHHGKVGITSKVEVKTRDDLSTAYTPGVAEGNWSYRVTKEQLLGADCGFFRSLNNIYKR